MQFSVLRSFRFSVSLLFVSLLAACGGEQHTNPSSLSTQPIAGAPANPIQQFSGTRNAYTIQKNSQGYLVTEVAGTGAAVQVTAQTTLRFLNVTVNLAMEEKVKQIAPKDLKSLVELYIAFFNRVPDADGLIYWIDRLNAGMSLEQMSENFYQAAILFSKETGYSATMSDAEFVKIIYKNVLARQGPLAPSSEEVSYWVGELTSGSSSKGRLISAMLNSAHTFAGDAKWGWVPQLLDNKVTVGTLFSAELGLNFLNQEDSIERGMDIIFWVNETSISSALRFIPMADVAFNLRGTVPNGKRLMGGAVQENALVLNSKVTTLAGSVPWADGDRDTARFSKPEGIAFDEKNLYIVDSENNSVRKLDLASNYVTTLAGGKKSNDFSRPVGIVRVGGDLYVSDTRSVRKIVIATGRVSTVAGVAPDGTGLNANFKTLPGITTDGINLFVVDSHAIRQIVIATGVVTTLAGATGVRGYADGIGADARFGFLEGICTDGANLYVTDWSSSTIRKLELATGLVTTLAGKAFTPGEDNGIGEKARFRRPRGITFYLGKLYVSDTTYVRQINLSNNEVSHVAGSEIRGFKDGFAAQFESPSGLVSDGVSLYVSDYGSDTVRKVNLATSETRTLSGKWKEAEGMGVAAVFASSVRMTTDGTNLYVADFGAAQIRKIVIATGAASNVAGANIADSRLASVRFITTDGKSLFFANFNEIKKFAIETGEISSFAQAQASGEKFPFDYLSISGLTTDGSYVYVADGATIRKIEIASGVAMTLVGKVGNKIKLDGVGENAGFANAESLTTDGSNLYVEDSGTIRKIAIATGAVTTLPSASIWGPRHALACDGKNLYWTTALSIEKMDLATGKVSVIAGGYIEYQAGAGNKAPFSFLQGITTDGRSLFAADSGNKLIWKID